MKKNDPVSLILILEDEIPATRRNRVRARLEELGVSVRYVEGGGRSYLEISGDDLPVRTLHPESWEGVAAAVPLTPAYPHAAARGAGDSARGAGATAQPPTVVEIGADQGVTVGGGHFAIMAGPCAIEDRARALALGKSVRASGAEIFRGGAYKPRTSPYAFQGMQEEGLRILAEVRAETGLPVVSEILDPRHVEKMCEYVDLLQVGSRNMQNFALLKELSQIRKPVLLKRGFSATIEELLLAAEYLLSGGNSQVILCERGIRSAAGAEQVVLDLGAVPEIRQRSHLPIVVDPSHSSARTHRVAPLARAAVAAGADGLLIEVHDAPDRSLSDGRQALHPDEFSLLVIDIRALRELLFPSAARVSVPSVSSRPPPSPRIIVRKD